MRSLVISCVALTCGGAERVISILSTKLAENYDSVKIVMWKDAPVFYDIDKKIEIISIETEINCSNYFKKILWFRSFLKRNKPTLVLSFLAKSSVGVLLASLGIKTKVIVAERNDPRFLRGGRLMIVLRDFLYTFATGILEQTENSKNYFKGGKLKKTSVIYNPVFMDARYVGIASRIEKKKKIVSVGRLEPQKNHELLIRAFFKVHQLHPDYQLIIYGEGECRANLKTLITSLHLSDCVFLPGNQSNVFDLIKDASAFVMTSNFEGMPNALIEAMCLGVPCISTKVAGAIDLIDHEKNGLLVDVGDESGIASSLLLLLDKSCFANKLGMNSSAIYEELSIEKIFVKWIDYLKSIENTP
ncbi:glycosyltransferase [Fibrobacter sp. HC4]|uniref:glycosyltransferase n=1 Tax=Fibrobacter sp. HC4 TaxID=3239812 RepID=UPI00201978FC|nr:glycosyltransferase [Fibrobacter succinogenes]MCL4102585.1 GalNAc-alpha-(1->4)-GalNAc-alpha-(1->3)-diNAcBac-PP-undecaprenol alpha-1,4-N-acetyl-D-galactosaminyltransferase [Fibrobacter succinogenes]